MLGGNAGVVNTINIHSPKHLSPYEAAREFEKVSRRLAFGFNY